MLLGLFSCMPLSFDVEGTTAVMTGDLTTNAPKKVASMLEEYPELEWIELLDCPGSMDDEICYLTEVNFRSLPNDRPDQLQAAQESWLSVGDQDVFPEQFKVFLFPQGENQQQFWTRHSNLAQPAYWISVQERIIDQEVVDFYPYRQAKRLRPN